MGDVRQKEIWQAMEAEMTRKEKEKEQVTYTERAACDIRLRAQPFIS